MSMIERAVVGVVYETDAASVRRVGQDFARSIGSFGASAAVAVGGAALAVAGALGGATLAAAQYGDEIAKMSRELGMSVEALTSLRYASDRSGVSSQQLGAGLAAVRSRLAGVARGSAEAAAAYADYGVEVHAADGSLRTAADMLPAIADALAAIPDEGDRAAAAARMLGESSGRLAVMLGAGSGALEDLQIRAHEVGAVMSTEAAEAAEALVDSMTDLRAVTGAMVRTITDALTPGLTATIRHMTEWLSASDGIARAGLDRVAVGLAAAMSMLQTPVGRVAAGTLALAAAIGGASQAGSLLAALGPAGKALAVMGGAMMAMAKVAALPLAIIGGVVLVLDDLYVAAMGGDSAVLRLAESLGIGAEAASVITGAFRLFLVGLDNWIVIGGEVLQLQLDAAANFAAMGSAVVDMAAIAFPPLAQLRDLIASIMGGMGAGLAGGLGALGGGLNALADSASLRSLAVDDTPIAGTAAGAFAASAQSRAVSDFGALSTATTMGATAAGQSGQGVDISVDLGGLTVGASLADAAQQAADAVRAAIMAQADAAGVY